MIVSLSLFGREIFAFEVGRRFLAEEPADRFVRLGLNSEISDDEEPGYPDGEDDEMPFGFTQRGNA